MRFHIKLFKIIMDKYLIVLCFLTTCAFADIIASSSTHDSDRKWRIVGGSNAAEGAHPHQISLRNFGRHSCGGSIVNEEWIITAAHCVYRALPFGKTVVTGSTKLSNGGDTYKVLKTFVHEKYNPVKIQNDAALLKVEKITFNDKVKPIIAETEYLLGDINVTISGWGRIGYPIGPVPNDLQEINVKTMSVEECQSKQNNIIDSEICTYTKIGEGACLGDSGGPLVRTVNGQRRLVGIVSWGSSCARGKPDVFTRVSSFLDWFNSNCDNCLN